MNGISLASLSAAVLLVLHGSGATARVLCHWLEASEGVRSVCIATTDDASGQAWVDYSAQAWECAHTTEGTSIMNPGPCSPDVDPTKCKDVAIPGSNTSVCMPVALNVTPEILEENARLLEVCVDDPFNRRPKCREAAEKAIENLGGSGLAPAVFTALPFLKSCMEVTSEDACRAHNPTSELDPSVTGESVQPIEPQLSPAAAEPSQQLTSAPRPSDDAAGDAAEPVSGGNDDNDAAGDVAEPASAANDAARTADSMASSGSGDSADMAAAVASSARPLAGSVAAGALGCALLAFVLVM